MIPKKIHYCWFGFKPFPKLVKECIGTWEIHLPDYEFILWDESNSPMDKPYVKEAYSNKRYAFVSDYVRFWALYNEGGIYFDIDIFSIRSINDLLNNKCFFGWETIDKKAISCGVIGSESKNKFIKEILDEYNNLHFNSGNIEKLVVPRLITSIYERSVNKEELSIYPYDYFYPFPFESRKQISEFTSYVTENTYAVHLWNLSWVSQFDKFVSYIIHIIKTTKS